jgi:dihydrofolate reductase
LGGWAAASNRRTEIPTIKLEEKVFDLCPERGSSWRNDFFRDGNRPNVLAPLSVKIFLEKRKAKMGKVLFNITMSLDGYVAGPNDGPQNPLGDGGERLFDWYYSGDTVFRMAGNVPEFKVSRASAELLDQFTKSIGAMVAGRRMFDIANAWQGHPPGEVPCFIVTHAAPQEWVKEGSPFTFVTEGVERAIQQAKAAAGDRNVAVSSANIAQQCLRAGLIDEIYLDLAPVLLGGGVRLFEHIGDEPVELERILTIDAPGVTHLGFRVINRGS